MYIYIYINFFLSLSLSISLSLSLYLSLYIYIYISTHITCIHVYMYTRIHVYMYTCICTRVCVRASVHTGHSSLRCRFRPPCAAFPVAHVDSLRGSSVKFGTIQIILAWPLSQDDTHKSRSGNNFWLLMSLVPVIRILDSFSTEDQNTKEMDASYVRMCACLHVCVCVCMSVCLHDVYACVCMLYGVCRMLHACNLYMFVLLVGWLVFCMFVFVGGICMCVFVYVMCMCLCA